jgi:DNA-binding response OmpR family regulator
MNKVLVVEHEPELRAGVCSALVDAGFEAEGAKSGTEALDHIRERQFDLVLFDLDLPHSNGFRFWDRFQTLESRPRAILMIGDDTPLDKLRDSGVQACRYVNKPLNPRVLVELAREVLALDGEGPPFEVVSLRPDWVELRVPCTIEACERSESFLQALHTGMPVESAERVEKAVHELMLNAVEWGGKLDPDRRVRVACIRTPRFILYRIADPGAGFRFSALEHAALNNPPDHPADHQTIRSTRGLRPGGFGILMARALVDEMIYNDAQNEVILINYLA